MIREELRRELIEAINRVLETWCQRFPDGAGGYFEKLNGDLSPLSVPFRRLHASARVLYVFSELAKADLWYLKPARIALRFMEMHWSPEQSLFVYRLTPERQPLDRSLDAYGHAFVLFAYCKHFEVSGDPSILKRIFQVDERCEAVFWNGDFYRERVSETGEELCPGKSQNHHMHFLEAYLELFRVTRDELFLERARRIYELGKRYFLYQGRVLERVDEQNSSPESASVEPGHVYEWAWLLSEYAELMNEPEANVLRQELMSWGESFGVDSLHGGVFDELSFSGEPKRTSKRIWALAEAVRALWVDSRLTQEENPLFGRLARVMIDSYLNRNSGWWEHLDRELKPLTEELPVTTMYHLLTCRQALFKT